jgi:hypothetical protein
MPQNEIGQKSPRKILIFYIEIPKNTEVSGQKKKHPVRDFIVKHRYIFLTLAFAMILAFQNCGRGHGFTTADLNSQSSQTNLGLTNCPANTVSCQTDTGNGTQTCTQITPQDVSLGPCVVTSCKAGFSFVNGACVSNSCNPGSQIACNVANGNGTRQCDSSGQYGACSNIVCNTGYYLNQGNCSSEFISATVNNTSEFLAVNLHTYNVSISTSPGAVMESAKSSLTAVGGSCPANRSWAPLNQALTPWTVDNSRVGQPWTVGNNSWAFDGSSAQDMIGCQWKGCFYTANGASSCLVIDTTCPNGKVLIGGVCTAPPPPTTLPLPTTTTTTSTTSTLPPPCLFDGHTVQETQTIFAYNVTSANNPGDYCVNHSQIRYCGVGGVLQGSYPYASCKDIPAPTPPTTTLPSCPTGQMRVGNACVVQCNFRAGLYPNVLYTCPNGVGVTIIFTSSCQSGQGNNVWSWVYLKSLPTQNTQYYCRGGQVFPE